MVIFRIEIIPADEFPSSEFQIETKGPLVTEGNFGLAYTLGIYKLVAVQYHVRLSKAKNYPIYALLT